MQNLVIVPILPSALVNRSVLRISHNQRLAQAFMATEYEDKPECNVEPTSLRPGVYFAILSHVLRYDKEVAIEGLYILLCLRLCPLAAS